MVTRRQPDRPPVTDLADALTLDALEVLGFARPAWWADALCPEYPSINFVDAELDDATKAAALQVCGRCAVLLECRTYAVADPSLLGIWGGTDTAARKAIRRAARPAAEPLDPQCEAAT